MMIKDNALVAAFAMLCLTLVAGCGEESAPSDPPQDALRAREEADAPRTKEGGERDAQSSAGDVSSAGMDAERVPSGPRPFVYATECSLPAEPPSSSEVSLGLAFPLMGPGQVSFPMLLTHAGDQSGRLFVVERFGKIKVFTKSPTVSSTSTFLDLSNAITTKSEGGLLGLAFHPNYADNGYFFVHYTELDSGGTMHSVTSRFQVSASDPNQADPASELRILEIPQPFYNHNGGMIAFGHEGYLYIGMGDGGAGGDPYGHGQNTYSLLGAMLRIDVDTQEGGKNYAIPDTNPFVEGGGLPEIWAWGLRNPWRFSFDTLTGALWAGDVGQNAWEEISVIEGGKNYGWALIEGEECFPEAVSNCDMSGMAPPVMVYPNAGKGSVTGGYVYRGSEVPSLYGTYIFADYEQDTIYLLPTEGSPPEGPALNTPDSVAGFGQDAEGEVYVLGLMTGTIYRFVPAAPREERPSSAPFPQTLSATGCFSDLSTMTPAEGVIPYTLNHPFWSDGAEKSRWMVLPEGGQIGFDAHGVWEIPTGALFIKHFEIDTIVDGTPTRTRLETRFLVQEESGVRGYTYRWNEAGTEATLLASGDTRTLSVPSPSGPPESFQWQFPARHQCTACHTPEAGGMLGTESAQLNREVDLHGVVENQLVTWANWGVFTGATTPADLSGLPSHPAIDDESASLEARARSWLSVNCSSCHMGGPGSGEMDLQLKTPLAETATCDVAPTKSDLGIADARLLSPGSALTSVLYQRAAGEPPLRMPPLASARHDWRGLEVLEAWISSLSSCP